MTIKQKILIVDNDKEFCAYLSDLMSENQYEPLVVHTGDEAMSMITSHCPEMILLEQDLPDMDGIKILKSVREWSKMPIIILSRRTAEEDKVLALDSGADDYVAKTCGTQELLARMRSGFRHTRTDSEDLQFANEGKIIIGDMLIDYNRYRVYMEGNDAGLTQNEFRLVALLGKYAGKVLTYEWIMKELWGPNAGYDNQILRVNMTNIRRKIDDDPNDPKYLFTENGVGYRMVTKEEADAWEKT